MSHSTHAAPSIPLHVERLTAQEVVRLALDSLGEKQVAVAVSFQAEDMVLQTSRKLQMENWSFNTDYSFKLLKDNNGYIYVPSTALRVEVNPFDYPGYEITQRGDRLYERRNNTYVFTQDIVADVTHALDWTELPEHARQYIATKAGRELQQATIGAGDLDQINRGMELEARSAFLELETTLSSHNMLQGNPSVVNGYFSYLPVNALRRF